MMDVKGMIAVGTSGGYVVVYSFGQEIKHVLGTETNGECDRPLIVRIHLTRSQNFRTRHRSYYLARLDIHCSRPRNR